MARPYPLQPADRSRDYSGRDASQAADRRSDDQNPYTEEQPGENAAPSSVSPLDPTFTYGQLAPARHTAPFEAVYMEGDTSGAGTTVHEVSIDRYGDDYDPTAPMRVRNVGSEWSLDTDHDGQVN